MPIPANAQPGTTFATLADGLDAFTDGRGWDKTHEAARLLADAAPELLDKLQSCIDELQACSAWQDALNGEDDMMLDAVNNGLAAISKATGTTFEPYKVGDDR
jgi:hypothetical protein